MAEQRSIVECMADAMVAIQLEKKRQATREDLQAEGFSAQAIDGFWGAAKHQASIILKHTNQGSD